MKIINERPWWQFVCTACGATIQAEPSDVLPRDIVDCEGDAVGVYPMVECGKCGMPHDVPDGMCTPRIRRMVEEIDKKNNQH